MIAKERPQKRFSNDASAMTKSRISKDAEDLISGVSGERRTEIARGLGVRLDQAATPADCAAIHEVAARLAEDAIETVRRALAISVRNSRFLPKDVGLKLAHDIEDVAAPFLEVTEIFTDQELCDIVRTARQSSKAAIARRRSLGPDIANSLAEHGDKGVAADLIRNQNAAIPEEAYHCLLTRFEDSRDLADWIAQREALPASIAARLVSRVSSSLHELLSTRYDISVDFINPVVEDSRMIALLDLVRRCQADDMPELVQELYARRELDPNFLLLAIRDHQLEFFEHALSSLSQQPLEHTRKLLRKTEGRGIRELCARAGVPNSLHSDIETAVRAVVATAA